MKKIVALALSAALFLLTGCSALLERERLVIRPYEWDKNTENALSGAEISNYSTLRRPFGSGDFELQHLEVDHKVARGQSHGDG